MNEQVTHWLLYFISSVGGSLLAAGITIAIAKHRRPTPNAFKLPVAPSEHVGFDSEIVRRFHNEPEMMIATLKHSISTAQYDTDTKLHNYAHVIISLIDVFESDVALSYFILLFPDVDTRAEILGAYNNHKCIGHVNLQVNWFDGVPLMQYDAETFRNQLFDGNQITDRQVDATEFERKYGWTIAEARAFVAYLPCCPIGNSPNFMRFDVIKDAQLHLYTAPELLALFCHNLVTEPIASLEISNVLIETLLSTVHKGARLPSPFLVPTCRDESCLNVRNLAVRIIGMLNIDAPPAYLVDTIASLRQTETASCYICMEEFCASGYVCMNKSTHGCCANCTAGVTTTCQICRTTTLQLMV